MDLLTHMTTSSAARIASQKLLNFITNFCIHTVKGKYTYRSAVLYSTNKVQEYNEITGNNGFLTNQARLFFINTLSTVRELASIHTQELIASKATRNPNFRYSYKEYIELATDMCDTLDEQQKLANSKRQAKLHILTDHDDITCGEYVVNAMDTADNDDEDIPYGGDNDECHGELSINKSMRGNPYNGPLLHRHVFTQMSKEGKDSWKSMGAKDRQVIMDS